MKNASKDVIGHIFASLLKASVAVSFTLLLAACGDDSGSSADIPDKVEFVSSIYNLGDCTKDSEGDTVFVKDEKADFVCLSGKWVNVDSLDSRLREDDENSSSSVIPGNDPESSSSLIDDPLCGDCNSSSSVSATYIEVLTKDKLASCDSSNIGLRALVLADSSYHICKEKGWAKDSVYLGYILVANRENLPICNEGNIKQRAYSKKDSLFFFCDTSKWEPEIADGYIVNNVSILGAAQKGPFKFDSPLQLREALLRNDSLIYSGRKYVDEISSNKGDFVIPKVNLIYPYAVLEVRGLWRNEVSGEYSRDSMTLRVLTDLSKRTEVNINLLTHLEYDRVAKLVSKGYSVYAAKKQADYEIMTAFGFATSVEYSEDLKTFVPSTSENYAENATLMAISLLFIGDRSETEIQNAIGDFKSDIADDGEWNNGVMKANMADWAESFDGSLVRANVKSWNILDIPDYESYLTVFWNNAYGLGGCGQNRYGIVTPVTNNLSKNYNVHYKCEVMGWRKATDFEKDTYGWDDGEEGEVKKGDVTATYYVFESGAWTVATNETAFGLCSEGRNGEIGKIETVYYICDNKAWRVATILEYDTDGFGVGDDGEVRVGKVNNDKYYVYENGAWRASANEIENNLGACVTSRLNEVSKSGSTYYTCKSNGWVTSTAIEYDTYQWTAGAEGEMKPGSVNSSNHYTYADGTWRATTNDVEYEFGACVASRSNEKRIQNGKYYICENKAWKQITAEEYGLGYCTASNSGVVELLNGVYYICKPNAWTVAVNENTLGLCTDSRIGEINKVEMTYYICDDKAWREATVLEYDTYGKVCPEDGAIVSGEVVAGNKYVCDAGVFRSASEMEISLNKGCVNYTESDEIKKQFVGSLDSVYTCKNKQWHGSVGVNGTLLDERDQKIYKTIVIGTQVWMAENLNYDATGSYCYEYKNENCDKYGRLYKYASSSRVCPTGWSTPSKYDFEKLIEAVGDNEIGRKLMSATGWNENVGTDDYGFSALPAGGGIDNAGVSFSGLGYDACFWSTTYYGVGAYGDGENIYVFAVYVYNSKPHGEISYMLYSNSASVRCVKN